MSQLNVATLVKQSNLEPVLQIMFNAWSKYNSILVIKQRHKFIKKKMWKESATVVFYGSLW
jgi:hypothetical protein